MAICALRAMRSMRAVWRRAPTITWSRVFRSWITSNELDSRAGGETQMRRLAIPLALVFSLMAAAQQPTARLEGQVTGITGEALSNATLRLQRTTSGPAAVRTAATDEAGNFVFENLETGRYILSAERAGYAPLKPGQVIALIAGQVLRDVAIKLTPHGVIAGKVTDADSAPINKAKITAYRRAYVARHWQLDFVQETSTGVDGSFQIAGLAPGRYY